jgi:hypothetical protein
LKHESIIGEENAKQRVNFKWIFAGQSGAPGCASFPHIVYDSFTIFCGSLSSRSATNLAWRK